MKNPSIFIWEDCYPTVAEAIQKFQACWRRSSTATSKHTLRLVEDLIEPGLSAYVATLPQPYRHYVPGIESEYSFSSIIENLGFDKMALVQRMLLKAFKPPKDSQPKEDVQFVATLETLIGLIDACRRKRPINTTVQVMPLKNTRPQGFCKFCGTLTVYTLLAEGLEEIEIYPPPTSPNAKQTTLRLSHKYCVDHRPKLTNDEWNPKYRKAARSETNFNLELRRLTFQSAKVSIPYGESGDMLIDSYIHHYVYKHSFQPTDEAELRHHARLMVDARLSDRKKKMVLLQRYGLSQSEIARILGIARQQVFRDLASVPALFRQLPTIESFHARLFSGNLTK